MLAATVKSLTDLRFPLYASPKLDGVRGVVLDGKLLSRSLKPIPNAFVTERFSVSKFNGLDGELILGSPFDKDAYRTTNSAVSRIEGTPDVKFYVFDFIDAVEPFKARQKAVRVVAKQSKDIVVVEQTLIHDQIELMSYENDCIEMGYEGVMLRSPDVTYKFGRSTIKEQGMMKLKRFEDSEAEILEVIEEMENRNEAKTSPTGRTERGHSKANMRPKGRAGALCVKDIKSGVQFEVGSGFTEVDREFFWRHNCIGKIIKYKFFAHGVKDKPRHPVYLGLREDFDQ